MTQSSEQNVLSQQTRHTDQVTGETSSYPKRTPLQQKLVNKEHKILIAMERNYKVMLRFLLVASAMVLLFSIINVTAIRTVLTGLLLLLAIIISLQYLKKHKDNLTDLVIIDALKKQS